LQPLSKSKNFWTATVGFDHAAACAEENAARINLAEANALLADPPAAELQARKILGTNATEPIGLYLLGAALHRQERHEAARTILEPLSQSQPQMGSALRELGFVLEKLGEREMVGNFEDEVRRLLKYLGLPFDEACLRFNEETRDVQTPSADQVRMPLYNSGVGYWRHYRQWLGPTKEKLGYVLDVYPEVPNFYDEIHVRMRRPLSLGQTGGQFALVRGLRQPRIELA
jgi:tetratricopeptide (TPR) repeat protein